MAEAELIWGEGEEEAFGNAQFSSGSLLRKIADLERIIKEKDKATKQAIERAVQQADARANKAVQAAKSLAETAEERAKSLQTKIELLINAKDATQKKLSTLREDYDGLNDIYHNLLEEIEGQDAELCKRTQEMMTQYEELTSRKIMGLLIQSKAAERKWMQYWMALRLVQMWIGRGAMNIYDMKIKDKELWQKVKAVLIEHPARPIWHASMQTQEALIDPVTYFRKLFDPEASVDFAPAVLDGEDEPEKGLTNFDSIEEHKHDGR